MNLPLLLVSAVLGLLILIVYVRRIYIRYIRHGTFFRFSSGVRTFGGGWNKGTDEKRQAKVATTTRGARLYIFPGSFASFVYYLSTRSSQHPLAFSLVLSFPFINTHFSSSSISTLPLFSGCDSTAFMQSIPSLEFFWRSF